MTEDEKLRAHVEAEKKRLELDVLVATAFDKPRDSAAEDYNKRIVDMIVQFGRETPHSKTQNSATILRRVVQAFRILLG